ncbi:hypothetical protein PL9214750001 [Planktothrix tepida PCC 9214]|uniref:Uncharacterized protein n=1 Tax=Planktothrix tepida PCC 9214 TaxID=671072 RepID=A0A1J1LTZ0_9CYAN|nr:hypothetical protein PL9214750001 [Planktothrix tepida PCC 9214]
MCCSPRFPCFKSQYSTMRRQADPIEQRVENFINPTETPEQWQTFLEAWEQACGYRPDSNPLLSL